MHSNPTSQRFLRRELLRLQHAFTLLELVVVIAVLFLLATVLVPALAWSTDQHNRAACRNNLRQIGVAMTLYAGEYNDRLLSARRALDTWVHLNITSISLNLLAPYGLITNKTSAWTCPNRPGLPVFEPQFSQWVIGYQYFGGMTNWSTPMGNMPSRSPILLSQSQPHWTLAADAVMKIEGAWGRVPEGTRDFLYKNMPPHRSADSNLPQGGNQVFADGSAQWVPFERMLFLHSWSLNDRRAFFYQDPKDFPDALKANVSSLLAPRY